MIWFSALECSNNLRILDHCLHLVASLLPHQPRHVVQEDISANDIYLLCWRRTKNTKQIHVISKNTITRGANQFTSITYWLDQWVTYTSTRKKNDQSMTRSIRYYAWDACISTLEFTEELSTFVVENVEDKLEQGR